jgi:hypothetical protein
VLKHSCVVFLFLALCGCATFDFDGGSKIDDVDQSLIDIQKVIEARLPLGKRATSANGREYFSNYFAVVDGRIQPGDRTAERFYLQVLVLGEERPYVVNVVVHRESRVSSHDDGTSPYVETGIDEKLAKVFAKRIYLTLTKRREDRSIVDDFRVF